MIKWFALILSAGAFGLSGWNCYQQRDLMFRAEALGQTLFIKAVTIEHANKTLGEKNKELEKAVLQQQVQIQRLLRLQEEFIQTLKAQRAGPAGMLL